MIEVGGIAWRQLAEQQRQAALAEPVKQERERLLQLWAETYGRAMNLSGTVARYGAVSGTGTTTLKTEAN